jgi:hypothetical protein
MKIPRSEINFRRGRFQTVRRILPLGHDRFGRSSHMQQKGQRHVARVWEVGANISLSPGQNWWSLHILMSAQHSTALQTPIPILKASPLSWDLLPRLK